MGDVDEVVRLSSLAERAREIARTEAALEAELSAIDAAADNKHEVQPGTSGDTGSLQNGFALSKGNGKRQHLAVTVDWPKLGIPRPILTIRERFATDTLVHFVSQLQSALGNTVLERLTTLRVSRGPLVSSDPAKDYRNPRRGNLYTHHRIDNTKYFVLTNNSNSEKVAIIRDVVRHLGLNPSTVRVELSD